MYGTILIVMFELQYPISPKIYLNVVYRNMKVENITDDLPLWIKMKRREIKLVLNKNGIINVNRILKLYVIFVVHILWFPFPESGFGFRFTSDYIVSMFTWRNYWHLCFKMLKISNYISELRD